MSDRQTYYTLADPEGWDFLPCNMINYRQAAQAKGIGKIVKASGTNRSSFLSPYGLIEACSDPNNCIPNAGIPCSAYRVAGIPVCEADGRYGFREVEVVEEITGMDALFGWRYFKLTSDINPFHLPQRQPDEQDIYALKQWAQVWQQLWRSWLLPALPTWVWHNRGALLSPPLGDPVRKAVFLKIHDHVVTVLECVLATLWAYLGSMFPEIARPVDGEGRRSYYTFQPAVDLWERGLISSFANGVWRLHSGEEAEIVWEGQLTKRRGDVIEDYLA